MSQFIDAYREAVASPEFQELERLRADARHNEASALLNAQRKAEKVEREKWQGVIAEKDAEIALLRAQLKNQNEKS